MIQNLYLIKPWVEGITSTLHQSETHGRAREEGGIAKNLLERCVGALHQARFGRATENWCSKVRH